MSKLVAAAKSLAVATILPACVQLPIEVAIYENNPQKAINLIRSGSDVNGSNANGTTALHHAAQKGYVSVAQALIDKGAKIDASERGGYTPLAYACAVGNLQLVQFLRERGANFSPLSGAKLCLYATLVDKNGSAEIAELSLAAGANPNEDYPVAKSFVKPLHVAVLRENKEREFSADFGGHAHQAKATRQAAMCARRTRQRPGAAP